MIATSSVFLSHVTVGFVFTLLLLWFSLSLLYIYMHVNVLKFCLQICFSLITIIIQHSFRREYLFLFIYIVYHCSFWTVMLHPFFFIFLPCL